jgi:hypothetical protein
MSVQTKARLPRTRIARIDGPSHDEIATRAYDRYLQRGAAHGDDLADWLEAERELLDLEAGRHEVELDEAELGLDD